MQGEVRTAFTLSRERYCTTRDGQVDQRGDKLIAGMRLRSGALQDDVGIILIEDAVSLSAGDAGRAT
jgi:hypothetical protein